VQRWLHRAGAPRASSDLAHARTVPDAPTYCYLLGIYLGDGHLVHRPPHGWTLKVACDRQYASIVSAIRAAMERTFSPCQSRLHTVAASGEDVVSISHPVLGRAFPQHGPGHKHHRCIALEDWQRELTQQHPGQLIRELLHSDGCR